MGILSVEHEAATNKKKKRKERNFGMISTCQLKDSPLQYYVKVYLTTRLFGS